MHASWILQLLGVFLRHSRGIFRSNAQRYVYPTLNNSINRKLLTFAIKSCNSHALTLNL